VAPLAAIQSDDFHVIYVWYGATGPSGDCTGQDGFGYTLYRNLDFIDIDAAHHQPHLFHAEKAARAPRVALETLPGGVTGTFMRWDRDQAEPVLQPVTVTVDDNGVFSGLGTDGFAFNFTLNDDGLGGLGMGQLFCDEDPTDVATATVIRNDDPNVIYVSYSSVADDGCGEFDGGEWSLFRLINSQN